MGKADFQKGERRLYEAWSSRVGEVRLLAAADGYVMIRRKGCLPFVVSEQEWKAMPPVVSPRKKGKKL